MTNRTDAADLNALLTMRRGGLSAEEIGEALGITAVAAHLRLQRAGLAMTAIISPRACVRGCSNCRRPFLSTGPHNRLCDPCRGYHG